MLRFHPRFPRIAAVLLACAVAGPTRADEAPPPTELPSSLTLDESLRIFRARGLDLLLADANVAAAAADLRAAAFVPNPGASLSYGRSFATPDCDGCSGNALTLGLTDNAAIADSLVGKRGLRQRVAQAALAAARMSRADAERTLAFAVKQQYFQAVQARALRDFAVEVQSSATKQAELMRVRYQAGAVNEAEAAKVMTAKLEADQVVDNADQNLRLAKVQLAFLLGARGLVPDFAIEADLIKFRVPTALESATREALLRDAFATRPDVKAAAAQAERARASIEQQRRLRVPDVSLSLGYTMEGTSSSAIQPPTLTVGVSSNLPIFYQQQGEIAKAEADLRTQLVTRAKLEAQVVSDVEQAFVAYTHGRRLVERMESELLGQAKLARDLVAIQYQKGAASLLEFLDAQRTYIAAHEEYFQDLTNYWTAVFQLEEATGRELR